MGKEPLISVIMSVYNDRDYIRQALDSLLAQTEQDFEIILVDDCSLDDTVSVIETYHDGRIRLYRNEKNLGLTRNLNRALRLARGQFIARMDGDDICRPRRFERQLAFLRANPSLMLISCRTHMFGQQDLISDISGSGEKLRAMMLVRPVLAHPGFMMRAELIRREGFSYDETFRSAQDYDFAARVAQKFPIGVTQEVLLDYRVHKKQVSCQEGGEQFSNADRVRQMQLERLGAALTPSQWAAYRDWAGEKRNCAKDVYRQAASVIDTLMAANSRTGLYDPDTLETELKKLLFQWMLRSRSRSVCLQAVTVCGVSGRNLKLLTEKAGQILSHKRKGEA